MDDRDKAEKPDLDFFAQLQAEVDRFDAHEGLDPADLLSLPPEVRRIVQALARQGAMGAADLAAVTALTADETAQLLDDLAAKGVVLSHGVGENRRFEVSFGQRQTSDLPFDMWDLLEERSEG